MRLPRKELLKGCNDQKGMDLLITQAETVLRTWQPTWSEFISAPLRETAMNLMNCLNDLHWYSDGGHQLAERRRLQCTRCEDKKPFSKQLNAPISGVRIEGNFLFDNASSNDIREALKKIGALEGELGDIWMRGDRGANVICTPEASIKLNEQIGLVRDVKITCEAVPLTELQLPFHPGTKQITSVESSTRIDAIASAGFGLSRSKITKQVKDGLLRLNWMPVKQPSQYLVVGDRIQLEGKGSLTVLSLELTKRKRWRVVLLRQ